LEVRRSFLAELGAAVADLRQIAGMIKSMDDDFLPIQAENMTMD
jgi:hypothetical protein